MIYGVESTVNWLDILLLVILAASILGGLAKGFARTGLGLMALLLGLFCGLWFYRMPANWLREYLSSQQLANLIGFLIILTGFILAGALLGALLSRVLKAAQLSWLDRLAGGAFGALQGVLLAAALITAFIAFAPKAPPNSVANSRVAPYVVHAARAIVAAAPREVKDGFRNSYERVKEMWSHGVHKTARKLPSETI